MEMKIKGMMCSHCVARVEKVLTAAGAANVRVDLERGTATFDAGDKPAAEYKTAIEDAGYDVVSTEF